MRVLILGADGYIGWPLAMRLAARGHTVYGLDNGSRRRRVLADGSDSAIPIASMSARAAAFASACPDAAPIRMRDGDVCDVGDLRQIFDEAQPQCVVHLAEIPSAPFSMGSLGQCVETASNNVIGTLAVLGTMRERASGAALVKIGTMGVWGTPPIPIPEREGPITVDGVTGNWRIGMRPGSFYHSSKAADSLNVDLACRIHGLAATDVHQGVVYGTRTDEMLSPKMQTRFDFDTTWGTAINRFVAQAIAGEAITPYGRGGQRRGFLPLRDSIACLALLIENPPARGEYRTVNQFADVYRIGDLAERVAKIAAEDGLTPRVQPIDNPRVEAEIHSYDPEYKILVEMGYQPTTDMDSQLREMFGDLRPHADRIASHRADLMSPRYRWR